MPQGERVILTGSERERPEAELVGPADPGEITEATIYLRERPDRPAIGGARLTRDEYEAVFGAARSDIEAVLDFAAAYGLTVSSVHPARRSIGVSGTVGAFSQAFETELYHYQGTPPTTVFRGRTGGLTIPEELEHVITAVLGLDERPQSNAHFRPHASPEVSYNPTQVAQLYDFPSSADGSGECVAIIELGGGYRTEDLSNYFSQLGLPEPKVSAVGVDGGTNTPGTADGDDGEVMLDIEVIGAIASGASVVVYFAPNTDQGFIDAVTTAVHDTLNNPSVVSISWGGAESTWTTQAMDQMESAFQAAATLGVTVTVAAGDNGSTDGVTDGLQHVDFPASAPHALACGGTSLRGSGGQITSETVWNDPGDGSTGGGISAVFPLPSYQADALVPPSANPGAAAGRGVPDVSGDADPDTGYNVLVDGQSMVIGGTSAVAPLWAGMIALLNQALGRSVGFVHPLLYAAPPGTAFHDITSGSNGAYSAGPGWDPCTGLGSPDGANLLVVLAADATAGAG